MIFKDIESLICIVLKFWCKTGWFCNITVFELGLAEMYIQNRCRFMLLPLLNRLLVLSALTHFIQLESFVSFYFFNFFYLLFCFPRLADWVCKRANGYFFSGAGAPNVETLIFTVSVSSSILPNFVWISESILSDFVETNGSKNK